MLRVRTTASLAAALILVSLIPLAAASAQGTSTAAGLPNDGIAIEGDYNDGKLLPLQVPGRVHARRTAERAEVGDRKIWLALDSEERVIYTKRFRLRGVGKHIEVWVAADSDEISSGLRFPNGDCRNDSVSITDRQVRYLIEQFDNNIYPKESRTFSVPPRRDGTDAVLPRELGLPRNYYKGNGRRIVTLIDNVRDDHFYDLNNAENLSYIAGFFYSPFNELMDRNVMTIDAFDWAHRIGPNPPHEPVPGDLCSSAPARPYNYEGVFAHEYQHLLEYYEDPNEESWVNEGISDWAIDLTNYTDPRIPPTSIGFDSHTWAFLGYLGVQTSALPNPRNMGPENSLTWWGDQPGDEILADYGAAFTMMEFLSSRFGKDFMTRFHRGNRNGLAGMAQALRGEGAATTPAQLVHEWLAAVALDGVLDDGAVLHGADPGPYRVGPLDASINWDTEHTYSTPGAPPNGADFVRLRDDSGGYLSADELESIEFSGGKTLPPLPVEWTVDEDPPGHLGDPALFSGSGGNFDRAILREVTVPQNGPTLSFDTRFETEEYWDYGFVQISTDGGRTWDSLSNAQTTSDVDGRAIQLVKQNLPGFTGTSGCRVGAQTSGDCDTEPAWVAQSFDLSTYAGQTVLLSFRYITDSGVHGDGWWIDDVQLGNQNISDGRDVTAWRSLNDVVPVSVAGWTVQLVAYDDAHTEAWIYELPLDANFQGALSDTALTGALGSSAQTVAALVTYDEPTELVNRYAPYSLTVNGIAQPGG